MTSPVAVAQRRGNVRRLVAQGLSNRAIGEELGISKDTVRRDREWLDLPLAERVAQRVAHTDEAVRQACAAAQSAADMRPAYVPTDAETARRWHEQLRAAAEQLVALADQFADHPALTPCATNGAPEAEPCATEAVAPC
ncbi:DNA-binding response regulator [Streptomyces sp. ms191]|uniref:LuxR C-terminal-related transcriptional regulator n=1 Tax=Streptomyces sp. ms191 TaxID=1827978 RepID=UPI0011CECB83|nr:LuxR C-terminal-related transcriptional regulator [Streptomyces sp. ms191]TXS30742.1 DNA-binding response regulator [Streptomyces sp. ms191]